MAKAAVSKVLVTNKSALQAKYGAAYASAIEPAFAALVAADQARGLVTRLVRLDSAADMAKVGAPPVTSAKSARKNKQAIDAIFAALAPAYLCIVGAPDVVPHQPLANPIPSDGDATAWSDLPYACAAAYSTRIDRFLSPSRVVGRLPDLAGGTDASYLVGLLETAAAAQSYAPSAFAKYLGITAKVWQASSAQSLAGVFGNSADLVTVPSGKPPWSTIGRRAHFINCHGALADPHFYGQQGTSYPVAHDATKLSGLAQGTVAAIECCYGAELYDPALANGQPGICNTYLGKGAYGYFGSSTIAYGPASGNGQADLVCQFFLKHVLRGASTGEAALQARLDFIALLSIADPTDLKTLAQFNLMGDPSLHPVEAPPPADVTVVKGAGTSSKAKAAAKALGEARSLRLASRPARRRHLATLGEVLGAAVASIDAAKRTAPPGIARTLLEKVLRKERARKLELCSFPVRRPAAVKSLAKSVSPAPLVDRVDVAVGELPQHKAPFRRLVVVVAHQTGPDMIVRRIYSR